MNHIIVIKEAPIEEIVEVNATIVEFDATYDKDYFEDRLRGRKKLIIVAYVNDESAGYIVGYDRFGDRSFYCWMAGVNPKFRKLGLLKKMMTYEDNWAKDQGYNKIKIKTRNNRREMLAYLVKYGFLFTSIDQHLDINENRIILEKQL